MLTNKHETDDFLAVASLGFVITEMNTRYNMTNVFICEPRRSP